MSLSQRQVKNLVFDTVASAEAAGRPDEVCYVQETKTFYDFVVAGSAYTVDDLSVLSTVVGGNTRWRARSGAYIKDDVDITGEVQGDLLNTRNSIDLARSIYDRCTDPKLIMVCDGVPGTDDAIDYSSLGHDGTFEGTMTSADRVYEGNCFAYDLDGNDDYIDFGDSDDFSFDDSAAGATTWMGVIEVAVTGTYRSIISKWDETTGSELREWEVQIGSNETLRLLQEDESANIIIYRASDSALSTGKHFFTITSPGDGGTTAMNNVKIYIDGVLVASTATNNASYIAMENTATSVLAGAITGAGGNLSQFLNEVQGFRAIDAAEWSAADVWSMWLEVKAKCGL